MKENITKIIALLLSLILIVSLAACGKDDNPTTTAGNEEADKTEIVTDINDEAVTDENGENVTQAVEDETRENDETAGNEDTTAKTDDKTETTTENDGKTTTEKDTSTTKYDVTTTTKMPSTTAEILEYYKKSVEKIISSKPGFKKTRSSVASKFEIPSVLKVIPNLEELIKGFMGIDKAYDREIEKGKAPTATKNGITFNLVSKVNLNTSDIKSATCKESGDNYIITITLKDGSSKAGKDIKATNTSPLDRIGICAGKTDYNHYDHKTAEIIYDAIDDTAENTTVNEKATNAKIVMKVNSKTGNIVSLDVTYDLECKMVVKVLFTTSNVDAKGTTTITYKNFKW